MTWKYEPRYDKDYNAWRVAEVYVNGDGEQYGWCWALPRGEEGIKSLERDLKNMLKDVRAYRKQER